MIASNGVVYVTSTFPAPSADGGASSDGGATSGEEVSRTADIVNDVPLHAGHAGEGGLGLGERIEEKGVDGEVSARGVGSRSADSFEFVNRRSNRFDSSQRWELSAVLQRSLTRSGTRSAIHF